MAIPSERLFELARDPREVVLPDPAVAEQRVLAALDFASPAQLQQGYDWYFEAHQLCKELGDEYDHSPEAVAGIIAVLSPRRSWENNVDAARTLLATGSCVGPRTFVMPAELIRAGAPPEEIIFDPKRNGAKVRAFFDNMRNPFDSDAVTVDRHIWNGLMGDGQALKRAGLYIKPAENAWAQQVYQDLAAKMGDVRPHQLQAASWVLWRDSSRRKTGGSALSAHPQLDFTA